MSREERLFDAIGGADESLLQRSEKRKKRNPWLGWGIGLAACLALVLAARVLLPGRASVPPEPANMPVDTLPAQQDPDENSPADPPWTASWPSEEGEAHYLQVRAAPEEPEARFRIYINREIYYSYEQAGVYIVCPWQEPDGTLECRLEISHMADTTADEALERVRTSLTGLYAQIEDLSGPPNGWYQLKEEDRFLFASDGVGWDDAQREVWIQPDGEGGVFVLASSYFMEATEGHGARFADMMHTFMPEGVYGQTSVWLEELRDAGERLMEAVFSDDFSGVEDLLAPDAEVSGYAEDVSGWVSVASIDCSFVPADPSEEVLTGGISVRYSTGAEDAYGCLTMEMERIDGQWKATRIVLER